MSAELCEAFPVRIVLLGDSGIGAKTSLLQRYLTGPLSDWPKSTRTPCFVEKTVVVDDVTLKLHIWGLFLCCLAVLYFTAVVSGHVVFGCLFFLNE